MFSIRIFIHTPIEQENILNVQNKDKQLVMLKLL